MAVQTVRPDATVSSSGLTLTGGASAHAILADNSDGSRIEATAGTLVVGMVEPTLPGGSVWKEVRLRARFQSNLTGGRLYGVGVADRGMPDFNAGAFTITTAEVGRAPLDAGVPGAVEAGFGIEAYAADIGGIIYIYELYADFVSVAAPVANITSPTGSIADNTPTITWTNTLDSEGGSLQLAEVRIFDEATYTGFGFDPDTSTAVTESGILAGGTSWTSPGIPTNGNYRAAVRIAQVVNGVYHYSAWDQQNFTINVPLPGIPTISAASDIPGRIQLTVDDTAGSTPTIGAIIERRLPGEDWELVRTSLGNGAILMTGTAILYDYEAPNGVTVEYRARAFSGLFAVSDWSAVDDTMWTDDDWHIKHPYRPGLNLTAEIYSQPGYNRQPRRGTFQALDADTTISVSTTWTPKEGDIVFEFDTLEEVAQLETMLETNDPLLIQAPPGAAWPDRWVMLGAQDSSRLGLDKIGFEDTHQEFSWNEEREPTGNILSWTEEE